MEAIGHSSSVFLLQRTTVKDTEVAEPRKDANAVSAQV